MVASTDGNGNVAALVNGADGTTSARYEYGPFAETLRRTGPMAEANPLRFATKYQDDETDLVYYGYRYYNPSTGRWISADPIGEEGGLNLTAFLDNSPTFYTDLLGLAADPNGWTWGEIGSWAIKRHKKPVDLSAPTGLGDAKASISAVCRRGEKCNGDKPAPGPKDSELDKAAWRNIVGASGTDKSGGAKYFCVNRPPPCGHATRCATCYCTDPKRDEWKRGTGDFEIENTGRVVVGSDVGGTLYFFNLKCEKDFNGWCTAQDQKNSQAHPECALRKK